MKAIRFLSILALAAVLLFAVACNDASKQDKTDTPATDQAEQGAESAVDAIAAGRDAYVATVQGTLDQVSENLTDWKAKVANLPAPAAATANQSLTALETAKTEAVATLDKIKSADPAEWESLKPQMDESMTQVTAAMDKVKSLF